MNVNLTLSKNFSQVIQSCFEISDNNSQVVLKIADLDNYESQFKLMTSVIFSKFLNTTRTGSAHRQAGISIRTFLSSMAVSVIYFLVQVLIFTILRGRLRYIYQASVLQDSKDDREQSKPRMSFFKRSFSWIHTVLCTPLENYRDKIGLDAYFFLRFLQVLAFFFLTLSLLNIPILIPINYRSSAKHESNNNENPLPWLDKMNMSNLVAQKSSMLVFHLILSAFVVVWFHALLISELRYVGQVTTPTRNEKSSVIFIEKVPESFMGDKAKIFSYFDKIFPESVVDVRFLPKAYKRIRKSHRKMLKIEKDLERTVTKIVINRFFENAVKEASNLNHELTGTNANKSLLFLNRWSFYFKTPGRYSSFIHDVKWKKSESYNWLYRPSIKFDSFSYTTHLYCCVERTIRRYGSVYREWNKKCNDLTAWEMSRPDLGNKNSNKQVYADKAFVKFSSLNVASAVGNLLQQGSDLDWKNVFVVPELKDVVWSNISISRSITKFVRSVLADFLSVLIIIGYILPVALIGLVSQIPYVGSLIPITPQTGRRSEFFNEVMAGVVPVITLIFLTEFVPFVFRWFSYLRCKRTGAAIELDTQHWFFAFLFVHVFLVVTISSSLSIVVEKIVNSPVSLATMLAQDLPKSSNFFCSFILLRGFAYSGGNLLQPKELLVEIYHKLKIYTPHERVKRMKNVPCFQWGSIYPIFSVLGCIGIIYSVISPLILPLSCIAFSLVLFSFKYLFEFQYQGNNVSETWGRLYPASLMQLYTGIYCMEFCLIGLLALANCFTLCILKILIFGLTILAHCKISQYYLSRLDRFNLTEYQRESNTITRSLDRYIVFPFVDCERKAQIWVPRDSNGIAKKEIDQMKHLYDIEFRTDKFHITKNGAVSYW